MTTMRWRTFDGPPEGPVTVTTYETPVGEVCSEKTARLVSVESVTTAEAIRVMRADGGAS